MHASDHPVITERYFFPRDDAPASPRMVEVEGASLACAHLAQGHPRTLLHFHGNGEVVADYVPGLPEILSTMGLNSFFAEFRGYGGSTGVPRLGQMLDDVSALVEAAGGPENLVVFGRSIGSIYAIEAVHRFPQIAGLILESGIADVLERILLRASPGELGCTEAEVRAAFAERFDHKAKLAGYTGPTLVLHAEHDHLVDKSHGERNARWAGGDCKLVILPRGDHNSIFFENRDRYLEELAGFVAALQPSS